MKHFAHAILLFTLALPIAPHSAHATDETGGVQTDSLLGAQYYGLYEIDRTHTSINFRIRHLAFSHVTGHFDDFSGQMIFDGEHPEQSAFEITIKAASIAPDTTALQSTLQGADFFDAEKYPDITFRSRRIVMQTDHEGVIQGDITILGITKPVDFDVTFTGGGIDPGNSSRVLDFTAHGSLDRSDFGMTSYFPLVGDEVAIDIQAQMVKTGSDE